MLGATPQDQGRAVHCLTQAVYYEAATEPREGQEAVAQVVLNRLKHPAFPKSVCGVVFEGAERTTGCQFTFTCDGSLARPPVAWRWDAAERVAAAALAGRVANGVGASTHYHAVWMTPYWSASLVQTTRIGGHVFYRMPGGLGSPGLLPFFPALLVAGLLVLVHRFALPFGSSFVARHLSRLRSQQHRECQRNARPV